MRKLIRGFKKNSAEHASAGSLKKKTIVCSTEAAAISIAVHLALLFFAGSIVAIRYVQKRDAAFTGENINRPKLERRQLQMPVKVQHLQRKSARPKVSTRLTTVSKTAFALPEITRLGGIDPGGFDRGGPAGERDLSALGSAGDLGFGISSINFFGARSKGEKVVFAIEADRDMMVDSKGGYYTYSFVKDRIHRMVQGMNSATLFNVILFNERESVLFRPQLVPATPENRAALQAWLVPLNNTTTNIGKINEMGTVYTPPTVYDSVVKDDPRSWLKAVQAAMELRADNIFLLCSGWGNQTISQARKAEMFNIDFSKEAEWLADRGWPPERIARRNQQLQEMDKKALAELAKENAARAEKGLPPKIIDSNGLYYYIVDELKWQRPAGPPSFIDARAGRWHYNGNEVIGHLEAVYNYNYIPLNLDKPRLHIVQLIASDGKIDQTSSTVYEGLANLKRASDTFRGRFEFLRGAKTMELLLKYNRGIDSAD